VYDVTKQTTKVNINSQLLVIGWQIVFHLLGHESIVLTLHVMYFIIKTRIYSQKAKERLKQEATADSCLDTNSNMPNNTRLFGLNVNMINLQ